MPPLRFGLFGLGRFGRHYARLLSSLPETKLAAVCRAHPGASPADVSLAEGVVVTRDADAIFSNPEIDCVVIATPTSTHAELAVKAIKAGKHVLIEKPMAMNVTEAEAIRAALAVSPVTFLVGYQYAYSDAIRAIRDLLKKNELGLVYHVSLEHLSCGPIRTDVGCFLDAGTHAFSILQYLFEPGAVVRASGERLCFSDSLRDDVADVSVSFSNGLHARIWTSWFATEKIRRVHLICERGMIAFEDPSPTPLKVYRAAYPTTLLDNGRASFSFPADVLRSHELPAVPATEPLHNELRAFLEAVATERPPITDFEFGDRIMRMHMAVDANVPPMYNV